MVPLILNGVLLVLGLLMLREFRIAMLSIRALRWRLAAGSIQNGGLGSETVAGESDSSYKTLRYSYVVEGEEYRSEQVAFGYPPEPLQILAQHDLQSVLCKAPEVEVYYDPRKPDVSVLMSGFKVFHALRMLLILLLFVAVWVTAS